MAREVSKVHPDAVLEFRILGPLEILDGETHVCRSASGTSAHS